MTQRILTTPIRDEDGVIPVHRSGEGVDRASEVLGHELDGVLGGGARRGRGGVDAHVLLLSVRVGAAVVADGRRDLSALAGLDAASDLTATELRRTAAAQFAVMILRPLVFLGVCFAVPLVAGALSPSGAMVAQVGGPGYPAARCVGRGRTGEDCREIFCPAAIAFFLATTGAQLCQILNQ